MAYLGYERKRKLQIYLLAALIILCCVMLVACNNDNSYSVAGDTVSAPTHFMAKFMLSSATVWAVLRSASAGLSWSLP